MTAQVLDSTGHPWIPFLHSSTKRRNLNGRWRKRRTSPTPTSNVARAEQLLREFRALMLPTDNEMSTSGLFRGGNFDQDCRDALHNAAANPQDV